MAHKKQFDAPPKRVALFVTCMVDMIYPEVGMATVELLERHGVEVVFPTEQTCCGQPAFNAGFWDEAQPLARRFIDIFEPLVRRGQVDAVVAPSGSCTTMTSHFYTLLLEEDASYRARAEFLGAATFELTEFLVDVLGVEEVGAHFEGKLAYHASCHLLRELGIDRQPRALLSHVEGAEFVELNGAEECCGFGGLFAIKNGDISTAMGQRKTHNIAKSDADAVALCDVSCMAHINGLLSREGQRSRAVHIAQVLTNQVDVAPRPLQTQAAPPAPPPRRWQDGKANS
ncbi:(Fe-S)-binding protein [Caldilinea sp.]|uniref:(Fe-S)-binding protein n=1 Tax=Caldilinea sp. TaxID=2293560 RepID=UPI002CF69308|nr:(Fe-S)-binding protein [Caldilinea sp.]HRA64833.1 (Fe-S)-binding protein [Caldilinea sp.]